MNVKDKLREAIQSHCKATTGLEEARKKVLLCEGTLMSATRDLTRILHNHGGGKAVVLDGRRYKLKRDNALEVTPVDDLNLD